MRSTVREELFNLPNMLTMLRIAGIPLVMLFIWRGEPADCVIAGWIYSAATITDYFDGYLARRQGLVTVLGKFLDPLADKLIVMAMLVMLVALHRVPGWLAVIILAREMTINGLRALASSEGMIIAAGNSGKIKTALQMIGILCLVIHYPYDVNFGGLHRAPVDFHLVGIWVMVGSVFFSLTSAVEYFRAFFDAIDRKRRGRDEVEGTT